MVGCFALVAKSYRDHSSTQLQVPVAINAWAGHLVCVAVIIDHRDEQSWEAIEDGYCFPHQFKPRQEEPMWASQLLPLTKDLLPYQ